jgi:hypothetical protein
MEQDEPAVRPAELENPELLTAMPSPQFPKPAANLTGIRKGHRRAMLGQALRRRRGDAPWIVSTGGFLLYLMRSTSRSVAAVKQRRRRVGRSTIVASGIASPAVSA